MIGGGLGPYAPGEWSDDTQMAVVIAQVAADHGLRDVAALDAVVQGWVDWLARWRHRRRHADPAGARCGRGRVPRGRARTPRLAAAPCTAAPDGPPATGR